MPFYENGAARIYYREVGSGFPLLLIPGGGLNSTFSYFAERATLRGDRGVGHIPLHRDGPAQRQPILILPDDIPAHPYAVARESALLAPRAEVSLYPWKQRKDRFPLAKRHVRAFLRAHGPATAAR